MLHTCDRVWLHTTSDGSTVVIEQERRAAEPDWLAYRRERNAAPAVEPADRNLPQRHGAGMAGADGAGLLYACGRCASLIDMFGGDWRKKLRRRETPDKAGTPDEAAAESRA